jgi:hypothetical protein
MIVAIHQPQYMPWTGYFHKIAGADLFVILDDVQFKKNEWQHRNRIRTSQGWQWLSVPNHYAFPQAIREVRLNNQIPWQEKHWRSLVAAYGNAPWFGKYKDDFEKFYAKRWENMAELNIDSIVLLNRLLGIASPMERSSAYHFEGTSTQRLVNICRHFKADMYLSGSGGKDYIEQDFFDTAGIKVVFEEFSPPSYAQHWSRSEDEFIPGLSVIDLLFNCGDESLSVLKGNIKP